MFVSLKIFALEDVFFFEDKTEVMFVLYVKYNVLVFAIVRFIVKNFFLIMFVVLRLSIIFEITENFFVKVIYEEFRLLEEIFLKFLGIEMVYD